MDNANYVQGTTAEYNDQARILGANAVMLYASDPNEPSPTGTSVVALDPSMVRLAFGDPVTGPKLVLDAGGITLSVGPPDVGTTIKMTADSITLTAGQCTLTLSATGGFSGNINQATTFAYAPSGIKYSSPQVEVQAIGNVKLAGIQLSEQFTMIQQQGATQQIG